MAVRSLLLGGVTTAALACGSGAADTAGTAPDTAIGVDSGADSGADSDSGADTAGSEQPVIEALSLEWFVIAVDDPSEWVLGAETTLTNPEEDVVGGTLHVELTDSLDVVTPFDVAITDGSGGALWFDGRIVAAFSGLDPTLGYTVDAVVEDAAGNESAAFTAAIGPA